MISTFRNYNGHNEIFHYWRIECISTNENASGHFVFKGKTLDGAIKAAKKWCKEYNEREQNKKEYNRFGHKQEKYEMHVGKVLYECDFWGHKI